MEKELDSLFTVQQKVLHLSRGGGCPISLLLQCSFSDEKQKERIRALLEQTLIAELSKLSDEGASLFQEAEEIRQSQTYCFVHPEKGTETKEIAVECFFPKDASLQLSFKSALISPLLHETWVNLIGKDFERYVDDFAWFHVTSKSAWYCKTDCQSIPYAKKCRFVTIDQNIRKKEKRKR